MISDLSRSSAASPDTALDCVFGLSLADTHDATPGKSGASRWEFANMDIIS